MARDRAGPRPDLAVVGAGVMGLVLALTARRAGLSVALFERADDVTAGAGWVSGGMLAPDCEADGSSADVVALGRRSLALWPALSDAVAVGGTLVVAAPRDRAALDRFATVTNNHVGLDAAGVDALEPALAGRFARGLSYPGEGHLDPRRTLVHLANRLEAAGVPIRFGFDGEPDDVAAGLVADTRGLGARRALPGLRGVRGEVALIRSRSLALARPVRLLHHRHPLYVVPRADGVFLVGATTIESEDVGGVSLRSAGELLTQAYALHPAFGDAEVLELRAGLRPAFPDNEPRIARDGRILRINGLYRHGWLLAPALAEEALAAAGLPFHPIERI